MLGFKGGGKSCASKAMSSKVAGPGKQQVRFLVDGSCQMGLIKNFFGKKLTVLSVLYILRCGTGAQKNKTVNQETPLLLLLGAFGTSALGTRWYCGHLLHCFFRWLVGCTVAALLPSGEPGISYICCTDDNIYITIFK